MMRKNSNALGLALILMSSVLLGIWAVKNTIALRNILLFLGAPLSAIYCQQRFQSFRQKKTYCPAINYLPLVMIGLMFVWVIFHYCFLSRFPVFQLAELKSTWVRSVMAAILGVGAGLAIIKRPGLVSILWIGILTSFMYLFCQYVPKALRLKSLFAPDYLNYIYFGKISGVLMGSVLLLGLVGVLLDSAKHGKSKLLYVVTVLWAFGTTMVLYAYVYIFDARNGIGLAVIIYGLILLGLVKTALLDLFSQGLTKKAFFSMSLCIAIIVLIGVSCVQQMRLNPGWSSMLEDVKTSIQIDEYPNWQNPLLMGYPNNSTGQEVKRNTYERVAWATVGATKFVPQNPLGVGSLTHSFNELLKESFPMAIGVKSTHSGWLDITLAYGFPGLLLLMGPLWVIFFRSFFVDVNFRHLSALLSLGIIMVYTIGELGGQHAIEILCFLIAFLGGISLTWGPQNLDKVHKN